MTKITLSNLDLFKVFDENTNHIYYGCHQEWYLTDWQRRAGCGPSSACNMISYLNHTQSTGVLGRNFNNKSSCLSLMEEIWEYVTPTENGISTTKLFFDSVLNYAKSRDVNIKFDFCDVPEDINLRPKLSVILDFLEGALRKEVPIAFLNLCNGNEENLDCWHWVTIISLEYSEDGSQAFVDILDQGLLKKIDLALWLDTTTQGGGFVYFTMKDEV